MFLPDQLPPFPRAKPPPLCACERIRNEYRPPFAPLLFPSPSSTPPPPYRTITSNSPDLKDLRRLAELTSLLAFFSSSPDSPAPRQSFPASLTIAPPTSLPSDYLPPSSCCCTFRIPFCTPKDRNCFSNAQAGFFLPLLIPPLSMSPTPKPVLKK